MFISVLQMCLFIINQIPCSISLVGRWQNPKSGCEAVEDQSEDIEPIVGIFNRAQGTRVCSRGAVMHVLHPALFQERVGRTLLLFPGILLTQKVHLADHCGIGV